MNAFYERKVLGSIQAHELLGEYKKAKKLKKKYAKEKAVIIEKDHTFEGVLVPAGWDNLDKVDQTSLFTGENEDILLEHNNGVQKFRPFLNQEVRIVGDISSDNRNERTLQVSKITRLENPSADPSEPYYGDSVYAA